MKKKLLFLGALMLTSLSSFAQGWTRPEVKGSELVPGDTVFLYNVEAAGFLRGLGEGNAPYWGARAGVATEGCDVIIIQKALAENVKEGTDVSADADIPWEAEWDGETYMIQNYASHIYSRRWDEVWFGLMDFGTIWTDRQNNVNGNTNFFWNFTKNGNGTYTISASPKSTWIADPDLYASLIVKDSNGNDSIMPVIKGGERLGVDLTNPGLTTQFEGFNDNAPLAYEWLIVKKSDFEQIDLTEFTRYNEAMNLKALLDEKKTAYPAADFSEAEDIYNNTSSSLEDLQVAKELVAKAIVEFETSSATPDNPTDMSYVIESATFDEIGNYTGWNGTKFGAGGYISTCAEHYNKNYNTYQDISIVLPEGIYKVGVKGFYRAGGTDNDWNTKDDPSSRTAKLYAVSGEDSLYTGIPALAAAASPSPVPGAGQEVSYAGMYLPNSMADFTVYKEAGLIDEVSVLVPVSNGKLRIGVSKETVLSNDWTIVDDFTLEYYGNTLAAYEAYRDQTLASYPAPEDAVADDALYKETYLATYAEVYNVLAAATDAATISTASTKLAPALDALNANIKAYQDYRDAVATAEEYLGNNGDQLDPGADSVVYLIEYISGEYAPDEDYPFPNGSFLYIIGNEEPGACTLETEQIYEEINYVKTLVTGAVKCTMEGGDVTYMLVNPDFTDGKTGWTIGSGCNPAFAWGVAEVYGPSHGHVDFSQTVTGAKPGIYSVSVHAYERPAANGSYDGTEESQVYLYMGDLETPVQNITMDVLPEDQAVDRENCLLSNDYLFTTADGTVSGYVPNSMEGGSIAFAAGRYRNECYGIVGEDGVLKIGLTSHGVVPHWVLFDDFKLRYLGEDASVMGEVILMQRIDYAYRCFEREMTEPVIETLDEAINIADDAMGSGDYGYMNEALAGLNKAIADAERNADVLEDCYQTVDILDIAICEYEGTATEDALIRAWTVLDMWGSGDYYIFATEELEGLIAEMKYAMAAVKIPYDVVDASDENPVDLTYNVIANPAFDEGATVGWLHTKNGGNGPEIGDGFDGPGFEFWNYTASVLQFNLYQEVIALPAGKYTVAADLANSYNGQTPGTNGGCGILYADVVVGTDTTTYSVAVGPQTEDCTAKWNNYEVTFDVPADAKVIVGTKSHGVMDARWYMGDSFTLTYYGAESSRPNTGNSAVIGKYSVIEVEAERAVGLGYNFDDVAVDMDSICGLLGISDISEARVWGVNATNLSYVRNAMQTYDGWRNMNGDFTYWSNNAAICYQYDADKAQFGLCTHPDMEPDFGAVVPAYWAFTHNNDTVLVKTTIKFETLESGLSLTINVDEPGTLAEKILAETANYADVKHLILSGTLNDDDINIIQNRLTSLRTIDLSGLNMKAIPDYMFSGNNSLCKVVLPEGLESIGYAAFQNCSKLEGIVLPATLKTIGSNAFYNCDKLQSIVIPEGVTTVGSYAFYGCGSLYTMEWPSTATTISDYAFYNTALLEIVIPEGVTAIGNSAFDHCQNITSIVCPSTLKTIGTNAFYNCNSLAMVEFNEGLETIGSYAFGYCALTDITLPSTLRYCDKPFEGCYNVSTVTSKSLVPPMLNDGYDIFASDWNGMDLSAIILYVPEWSAIKYRTTIGWDVYGTVEPIEDFLPENIVVSDKFKFTLPDSLPSDYKPNLTVSYVEGDWIFGSLELKGNSMLSVDKYEMTYDFNTDYNNGYWDDTKPYHTALINKANMRADSVVVTIYNHNDVWTFISFPYDVKVSDIVPVYENTNYVIRKYSGMDRANGNFGNTWVGMTGDSILRAGEGYIWQSSRCDNNDVWQNWSGFHVPAMDNGNKNMIFANSDREITLNEYQSEFSHNRSWNLVGNPYPSYYDIRYMDFTAPITVWSSRNATYYAYSPVDDEFILSPGEAFFVQRPVDLGTITFVAEGRQTDRVVRELGAEAKRFTDAANERQVYNLVLEGNEKSDRTRFVINANAACDYDMCMDANKFMSTDASVPQLYTIEGNVHFAINERPMGSGNISLGAYFGCKGVYTIALNTKVQGMNVVLIDNLTGVETDLMNDNYTFDADSGVAEGRFEIRLSAIGDNDGATGIDGANANASVKAVDGQIVVDLSASAYIEVYKVDGTRVAATAAASATFDVEPGVYMVKVQNAVHKVSVAR